MITSIIQNNSSGSIGASQEFSSIALEVSSSQSPQNLNLIENLNRQVFDSASFASTYDTRFTQLGDVTPAIEKFLILTWLPYQIFLHYTMIYFMKYLNQDLYHHTNI